MLKYVATFVLSLILFVPYAQSQHPKLTSGDQAQKAAAEREVSNERTPEAQFELMQREQVARVATERQAELRRDTEKLVTLTAELKQNVDKTGVNVLSLDVIRKAQEIQKLAKSVQDKMKNAF